jgi:hypothetical protein
VQRVASQRGKPLPLQRRRRVDQLSSRNLCDFYVDVAELSHKPMPARSSAGDRPITATLKACREALQAELTKAEAFAAGHQADFERSFGINAPVRRLFAFKFPSGYFSIKF